ncbi:MAG: plastoquinol--plastocyanin reductase [candidate division Zixibacteria bacterium HGW-Zixibacteria-1]|nr:MAG: plastoquinol--plastocyanin reductase [candidate division Zixibacteria bacterium HGW-Zixibacteria-1]
MTDIDKGKRDLLGWLLKGGIGALMASVLYPVYKYVIPPASGEANVSQIKLPFKLAELKQDEKKSRIFKFGRDLGIIVVTANQEVKAFSALCTHLDCTVQYRTDLGIIWCACHNGQYDLEGRNIGGPPPRPLEKYAVHIDEANGEIFVSKA